jgi:hypothetical protein
MVNRRAGRPSVVEDRLLRRMTAVARVASRSHGRARMRAMALYIETLQAFTDRAIGSLQASRAAHEKR